MPKRLIHRSRRRSFTLAVTLAASLLASACSSGGGGTTATQTGTGAADGTLVIGMTATNIPLLDTTLSQNEGYEGIRFVGNQLYDGLSRFDLSTGDKIPPVVPALAESWTPNADLSVWTFKLRPNVTFHDGEPWNADAAMFTLDRILNESSPQYYPELNAQAGLAIGGVESARKVDDMTVEIATKGPWSHLPADLTTIFFGSPKAIKELGNEGFGKNPVGTGPFKFKEFVQGQRLVMERNADYWRGAPKLQTVILRPIPDPTARVAALRGGEVNWIEVPLPDDVASLESEGFTVHLNSYDHEWPWVLDTSKPPFDDKRVRQALNYAIDRDGLAESILQGTAAPLPQAAAEANFAFRKENDFYTYDPDKAKKLLADAGYPDGFTFRLSFPTSGSGNMVPIPMNEALQSDLAKIGVKVELEPIEWAAMLQDYFVGKIPGGAEAINISLSYQQEGFWNSWYGTGSATNAGKYSNAEVDALFKKAKTIEDADARSEVYADAAKVLTEDAPWLFIVSDLNPRATAPSVKDFTMPKSWFVDLTGVSVTSGSESANQ
ncbi:MAG: ABC transporter substrate-binding protein [Acidimicrobiales bacterium]